MPPPSNLRRGFTLVELLVVIAIIGILVSLLLPAVQAAREAGRRSQCMNSQRQIVLALHMYHDTNKRFPAGQYCPIDSHIWERWSWFHSLLPFVEQTSLYELHQQHYGVAPQTGTYSYTDLPNKANVVPMFMCPGDGANPKTDNGSSTTNTQGFHGNYVLLGGNDFFNPSNNTRASLNGMFYVNSKTSFASVTDGTSNTLCGSEILLVTDGAVGSGLEDIRGRYHNVRHVGALFSTKYPPNTTQPDRHNYCLNGRVQKAPCTQTGTDIIASARSNHPGGVVCCLVDGSTRFMSNTIDALTYSNLGTRNGGEAVSGGF